MAAITTTEANIEAVAERVQDVRKERRKIVSALRSKRKRLQNRIEHLAEVLETVESQLKSLGPSR